MTNEAENPAFPRVELLRATDAVIDDAVSYADPMMLRGLLFQLTGDEQVASTEVTPPAGIDPPTVAREADVAFLRARAASYLKAYRDSGAGPIDIGPRERLPRSLALAGGVEEVPPEDLECWLEEVGLDPHVRGLTWNRPPPVERLASFSVVVIGAGMGGLNAAVQLEHAGIDFTVLEKNPEVGGTWFENSYPGRARRLSQPYLHPHLRRGHRPGGPVLRSRGEPAVLQPCGRRLRRAPAHRLRHRGRVAPLGRGRRCLGGDGEGTRGSARVASERRDQRSGAVVPSEHPRLRRSERFQGPVVPYGALARRPRPGRPAGRRRRNRLFGDPVGARARAPDRARRRLPAEPAMALRPQGVPGAVPPAGAVARPELSVLQELHAVPGPVVDGALSLRTAAGGGSDLRTPPRPQCREQAAARSAPRLHCSGSSARGRT